MEIELFGHLHVRRPARVLCHPPVSVEHGVLRQEHEEGLPPWPQQSVDVAQRGLLVPHPVQAVEGEHLAEGAHAAERGDLAADVHVGEAQVLAGVAGEKEA